MRRTVLYTAGLLFAAGAGLALAGPAAAAPAPVPGVFSPFTVSTPTQVLGQVSWGQQAVVGNTGNPQFGLANSNGGGSAYASNSTSQGASQYVGGLFAF